MTFTREALCLETNGAEGSHQMTEQEADSLLADIMDGEFVDTSAIQGYLTMWAAESEANNVESIGEAQTRSKSLEMLHEYSTDEAYMD